MPELRRKGGEGMNMTNEKRRDAMEFLRTANCYDVSCADCRKSSAELFGKGYENALCHMDVCSDGKPWQRLADLIDPDRDLTCELELTFSETVRTPVRVYECDCCGRSCDSVYAEDYVYCPYCGRLNTAREVEAEE